MDLLVADIGGTHSRCAIASAGGAIGPVTVLHNTAYPDIARLLADYLDALSTADRPKSAALAIAAPIRGDDVQMINIGWRFSRRELQDALGMRSLRCLNDFEALAWALPTLDVSELVQVGGGSAIGDGCKAVLGPGTGLGVASLVRCGPHWQAMPGEGGHVTLAAQDADEERVIRAARDRFGHCSAERLLSGSGLSFLHQVLHGGIEVAPEEIGRRAAQGDGRASATLEIFFRLLGTVAGNLALTVGAFGGVYVGGGIVPRYLVAFLQSGFRRRFEAKGRYADYMRAIPTWVITAPYPTLKGVVAFTRPG